MADQIAFINLRPVWARVPLLLAALLALYVSWYCVASGVGSTMAETAPGSYANDPQAAMESAAAAVRLAPNAPETHLMLARLSQLSFEPEGVERAMREYEEAARLAPNDYLVWLEAGRARAALGDPQGGVEMLRRSVALAPNYAQPHWHLGNALLRAGQTEEAFAEMQRAADADAGLRPQVFNLAWQVYGPDMSRVIAVVGKTPEARAQLVSVLGGRGRFDDALAIWEGLDPAERRDHMQTGAGLANALYGRGQFHLALRTLREAGAAPDDLTAEKVWNGGFESDIGQGIKLPFMWEIAQPPGAQIAIDARVAASGRRSLRIVFNSSGQLDFGHVSQTVAAEPSTRYRLTYSLKTEELRSVATLYVVVTEATAGAPVTLASPQVNAPTGTNEWKQNSIEFTTGPNTEAFVIHIARVGCTEGSCPIYGKIWYDDFNLERVGGRPAAR
ncbi:MAG TPA: tetratricopeptide repeat protein [Pyrinomonadaceae bacterium]|nr:tetratricopeptide repeat protein [Pyrinomonadaceae bacterium]